MDIKLQDMSLEELEDFVFNEMDNVLDYDTGLPDLALAVAKALKEELETN